MKYLRRALAHKDVVIDDPYAGVAAGDLCAKTVAVDAKSGRLACPADAHYEWDSSAHLRLASARLSTLVTIFTHRQQRRTSARSHKLTKLETAKCGRLSADA